MLEDRLVLPLCVPCIFRQKVEKLLRNGPGTTATMAVVLARVLQPPCQWLRGEAWGKRFGSPRLRMPIRRMQDRT